MLHISLGGGFEGHHVTLLLDGRPIFDREEVRSSPLLDLAEELPPVDATGSACDLSVLVGDPNGAEVGRVDFSVSTADDRYIVIYLEPARTGLPIIRFATSARPMGFG